MEVISRDNRELYRIAYKGIRTPDGHVALHWSAGKNRLGPVGLGHGWYLIAETPVISGVEKYIPLEELKEHNGRL